MSFMFKGKIKTVSPMQSIGQGLSLDSSSVTPVLSGRADLLPLPQMSLNLPHLSHESELTDASVWNTLLSSSSLTGSTLLFLQISLKKKINKYKIKML